MDFRKRLSIAGILPQQGTFNTMIIAQDITEKVKLTQKEMEDAWFKVEQVWQSMQMKWDDKKEKDVKIEFTNPEKNLIKETLEKLSKDEKISLELIPLYKEFV